MVRYRDKMLQFMQMRAFSSKTIECYLSHADKFFKVQGLPPAKISVDHVHGWLHQLIQRGVSRSYYNQAAASLRLFFRDIYDADWSFQKIPYARKAKKMAVILTPFEIERIIHSTENPKHRAMIAIGYASGLRVSEAAHLKCGDLEPARDILWIRQGKGAKDRLVVMSKVWLEMITQTGLYLPSQPQLPLFRRDDNGQALSVRTFQIIFKNALSKSGVSKPASYHTLRHCFATHMMEQDTRFETIQRQLGHRYPKTTYRYLHVRDSFLLAQVQDKADALMNRVLVDSGLGQ
jgi:integrase/recombinase XerD